MSMSGPLRVSQILAMTDEFLRRLLGWLQDPHGGPVVPERVAVSMRAADLACSEPADVPDVCLPLQTAISRVVEEYRGYRERELGRYRCENGAPGPGFWAAMKEVVVARQAAEKPLLETLEPVGVLLQQGVTHAQIARHIYGRRGAGPFLQADGDVDQSLIEREAREPGSVIPANWIPPWHVEAEGRRRQRLSDRLQLFSSMEVPRRYDDPCTVEEMLQQGAFVQQVERAKGVSRDEVLEAAQRIGVVAVDRPDYQPQIREISPLEQFDDEVDTEAADRLALKQLVIRLYSESSGQRGAAEIAGELRKLGHAITTNAVSATIGHWKKRQQQEASSLNAGAV